MWNLKSLRCWMICLILVIISGTSNIKRWLGWKNNLNINRLIFAPVTYFNVFAPSVPTFKHVWNAVGPRPSTEFTHFAPRNALPSSHVIENGFCDLTDLFSIFYICEHETVRKYSNQYDYFATRSMTFCGASHLYWELIGVERLMTIELYTPGD